MICPKCGAEYRQGYTSCADCHVFLVSGRPQAGSADTDWASAASVEPGDPTRDPFCSFWKGNDARVCLELRTVLDEAGIPHKTVHRQDHLFHFNNQPAYELGVPASLYGMAEMAVKEAFGTDEETGQDAVLLLPPPAGEPRDVATDLRDAIADANEWLGPRYPEDATISVWEGGSEDTDRDTKEMVLMSLRENDLLCRSEEGPERTKVMVLPEDEARAKEIVREIVEGAPLD